MYLAELALKLKLGAGLNGLGRQFGIATARGGPRIAALLANESPAAWRHCAYMK